eukprot:5155239-Amphidinium_carterae.2
MEATGVETNSGEFFGTLQLTTRMSGGYTKALLCVDMAGYPQHQGATITPDMLQSKSMANT